VKHRDGKMRDHVNRRPVTLSRYNTSSTTREKSGWRRSKKAESPLTQYFRALTRSVEQQAQFV
jgi:hypothetical protein